MKRQLLVILLVTFTSALFSQTLTIHDPFYEATFTGVKHVRKIELTDVETRLHIHCTFEPKWWIKFQEKPFIQDSDTGEKYYCTKIIGGEFDKEIFMPASGDSTFVLIFPKLKNTVKRIDYWEKNEGAIFGLSLDPNRKKTQASREVPVEVQQWLNQELAKAKKKPLVSYSSPDFFNRDSSRLIGYLRGYDRRFGFNTAMIYSRNDITGEEFPAVVTIYEDGRFEAATPMFYPEIRYITFSRTSIPFYNEPGQTLSMIVNWEEILTSSRTRNGTFHFKDLQFNGTTAGINQDLTQVKPKELSYTKLLKVMEGKSLDAFKDSVLNFWNESENQLERDLNNKNLTEQAKTILRNQLDIANAVTLLNYVDRAIARPGQPPNLYPFSEDKSYYDFLKRLPINSQSIVISPQFSFLINRFEFNRPFRNARISDVVSVEKSFDQYLFSELGLTPTDKDRKYLFQKRTLESFPLTPARKNSESYQEYLSNSKKFEKRYNKYLDGYFAKYPKPKEAAIISLTALGKWHARDSILHSYFDLPPNLLQDIAKVRSLRSLFENQLKNQNEEALKHLNTLQKSMANKGIINESNALFRSIYHDTPTAAYALPAGKGSEIFQRIIDANKGKMQLVSFWGTKCESCINVIKRNKTLINKYSAKKMSFIFVTTDEWSPESDYNKYVKELGLKNSYRISKEDYGYLQELFKLHTYSSTVIAVDKKGKIVDDKIKTYNLEARLVELTKKQ